MTTQTTPSPSASSIPVAEQATRQDVLPFNKKDIRKIEVVDTDFVVTLADGKKVVIRDGALRAMMFPDYQIKFNDLAFNGQMIIQNAGSFDFESVAKLTGRGASLLPPEPISPDTQPAKPVLQALEPSNPNALPQVGVVAQAPSAKPAAPVNPEGAVDKPAAAAATAEGKAAQAETTAAVKPSEPVGLGGTGAAEASTGGFFAGINPAWGALGALGALGAGGGGGGDAVAAATGDPIYVIRDTTTTDNSVLVRTLLNVVLGEVNADLKYTIKTTEGDVLAEGTLPAANGGELTLDIKTEYQGFVEVTIADLNRSDALGYLDEATGQSRSLANDIRAVAMITPEATNVINVTPLTEVMVRWLYSASGGQQTIQSITEEAWTQANDKVARAVNLVTDETPLNLVTQAGLKALNDSEPSAADAEAYAQALAALSGYDQVTGSMSTTLTQLTAAILSLPSDTPSSAKVGVILATGITQALEAMVNRGDMLLSVATPIIQNVLAANPYSSLNVSSILFDSEVDWIQKGDNTFLLNFNKSVSVTDILNTLQIDGVSAAQYGIVADDFTKPTNNNVSRQWSLNLSGALTRLQTDADGQITLAFNDDKVNTGKSQAVTLEIGSVDPVMVASGLIGAGGTTPSYQVTANPGLTKVLATISTPDGRTIEVALNPITGTNSYSYTFSAAQGLTAGNYDVVITMTDQYGNEVSTNGSAFTIVSVPTYQLSAGSNSGWVTGYDEALGVYTYDAASVATNDFTTNYKTFTYEIFTIKGAEVLVTWNEGRTSKATEDTAQPGRYTIQFTASTDGQYDPVIQVRDAASNEQTFKTYYGTSVLVDSTPLAINSVLGTVAENTAGDASLRLINLPLKENNTTDVPQDVKFWGRLSGPDAAAFELLNGNQLRFKDAVNFEAKSEYFISLTHSDTAGNVRAENFVIKVSNVNEAPTVSQAISFNTVEDAGTVSLNLTQFVSDVDLAIAANNDNLSVSINASQLAPESPGLFSLDADGKTLLINTNHASLQSLGKGEKKNFTLSYQVRDSQGLAVSQSATIQITGTNDRPTVNNAQALALTALFATLSGVRAPKGPEGELLTDLVTGLISDADAGALTGVAITGVLSGLGQNASLFVSLDNGTTWTEHLANSISENNALLLALDDRTRLYFQPRQIVGEAQFPAALTLKAWDRTDGKASNTLADLSGLTSVSTDSISYSLKVNGMAANVSASAFALPTNQTALLGGVNYGVAVADFNQDGVLDFYAPWAGVANPDQLYYGARTADTVTFTETLNVTEGNEGSMVAANGYFLDQLTTRPQALDYNNDGQMDLLMNAGFANVTLLENVGSPDQPQFLNVGWSAGLAKQRASATIQNIAAIEGQGAERMAIADFNGDGFVDIVVASATPGRVSMLQNNGNGTFGFDNAWNIGTPVNSSAMGPLVWGDFNGDGFLDLFSLSTSLQAKTMISMGGIGGYDSSNAKTYKQGDLGATQLLNIDQLNDTTPPSQDQLVNYTLTGQVMAVADYDQDGRLDVFVGGATLGNTSYGGLLLHNQPDNLLTSDATNAQIKEGLFDISDSLDIQGEVRAAAWLDFDMDGRLDLLVSERNDLGQELLVVFINKGTSWARTTSEVTGLVLPDQAQVMGFNVADLNNDGALDVLVNTNQGILLFNNGGASQTPSLSLQVLGKVGDTPLYGAKVVVYDNAAPTKRWTQFVQGDTGEGTNQGELVFYGLDASRSYNVEVTYAFDANPQANTVTTVGNRNFDSGINLVKTVSTYKSLQPGAATNVLRIDPSNPVTNADTGQVNTFAGWNPVTNTTDPDGLVRVLGTDQDDVFTVDPKGARIYEGGAGNDELRMDPANTTAAIVTLLHKTSNGVSGVAGFQYNPDQQMYSGANPFWIGGNRATSNNMDLSIQNQFRTGAVDFTGIDKITLTDGDDVMLDGVGMTDIEFGDGKDLLYLAPEAVNASGDQVLTYDGGDNLNDEVDFRNLNEDNFGPVGLTFKWLGDAEADTERVEAFNNVKQTAFAVFEHFEKITGTMLRDVYDYRAATRAYNNIVVEGSNDTWYDTTASASNTDGDTFYINTNNAENTLDAKIFTGGVDATFDGNGANAHAAGNDRLIVRMVGVDEVIRFNPDDQRIYLNLTTTSNGSTVTKFSGSIDNFQFLVVSRYTSLDMNLLGMDHGVTVFLNTQATSFNNFKSVNSSKVVGTAFADTLYVGDANYGTNNDVVTGGAGNDYIEIRTGDGTSSSVNGRTTLVYQNLGRTEPGWGNGTDRVKGFSTDRDATWETGEDVLDFSAWNLNTVITSQAQMSQYFQFAVTGGKVNLNVKTSPTSAWATVIQFDDFDTSVTWDASTLWALHQAGQIVL